MATTYVIPPYELHTSAPGYLYNKPEWDAVNNTHPAGFDFGAPPKGWPLKFTGPGVWTGEELERNRTSRKPVSKADTNAYCNVPCS